MISVRLQGKPFNITIIQVYAPTTNAKEAEVEWFYEDLGDFLELTAKKKKKFGLEVQNEGEQRLTKSCQENTLVIANTLFQQDDFSKR